MYGDENTYATIKQIYVASGGSITFDTDQAHAGNLKFEALDNYGTITQGKLAVTNATSGVTALANASTGEITVVGFNLGAATAENSGKLTVTGDFKLEGKIDNKSGGALMLTNADITGTLENAGTAEITTLSVQKDSKITNSGTITVGTFSATSDTTYTQTGTGSSISVTDGWFTNSTINLEGGTIDRADKGLGTGNKYVVKNASWSSTVAGGSSSDWKTGMSVLKTDEFTGSSTVTLQKGGLMEVTTINLDSAEGTVLTLEGGALQTSLSQFFTYAAKDVLSMDATSADDRVVITSTTVAGFPDILSLGEVKDSIKNHTVIASGDIVFTDSSVTASIVSAVSKRLEAVKTGSETLNVHYQGTSNFDFTVDTANSLVAENNTIRAIFDNSTLKAVTAADSVQGKTLVIGDSADSSENLVKYSIGFQSISDTETVKIKDGKELALIGSAGTTTTPYESLVGTSGTVTATGTGSKFTLGTLADTTLKGSLNTAEATSGGTIYTKAGEYKITNLKATAGGTVETAANGKLIADNLTVTGTDSKLVNAGSITVNTSFTDDANAVETNSGAMTLTGATTVKGTMTNESTGTLKVTAILTVEGTLTNKAAGDAVLESVGLTLAKVNALINEGNLKSTGENTISAEETGALSDQKYAFTNKAGAVADLTAAATTIKADTHEKQTVFWNAGTVAFGEVTLSGSGQAILNNEEGGIVTATAMSVGATAQVSNGGTITTGSAARSSAYDTTIEGTVENTGTYGAASLLIKGDSGKFDNKTAGTVTVSTLLRLEDSGTLITRGTVSAAKAEITAEGSKISVQAGNFNADTAEISGGTFTVEGDCSNDNAYATLGNLTQTGGKILVTVGNFTVTGAATLTGGNFIIKGDQTGETCWDCATATMKLSGNIENGIAVENGKLTLHGSGTAGKLTASYPSDVTSILEVNSTPVTVGTNGKIAVGSGAEDKLSSLSGGSVWFGADSALAVDTSHLKALTSTSNGVISNGTGATIAVENGSKLVLTSIGRGKYYLARGFTVADTSADPSNWTANIYPARTNAEITVSMEGDSVVLQVKRTDPGDGSQTDSWSKLVDEVVNDPDKRGTDKGGAIGVISRGVEDGYVSFDDQPEFLNNVIQLEGSSGVFTQGMTLAGNFAGSLEGHLSASGDGYGENGQLLRRQGLTLWADAMGQHVDTKGFFRTGNAQTNFDGTNYGLTFGGDVQTGGDMRFGLAFGYQFGDIKTKNKLANSTNKADAYSGAFYASKDFGKANLFGFLGYTRLNSDVKQDLSAVEMGSQTMHNGKHIVMGGIRGEYRLDFKKNTAIIPYIGLRVVDIFGGKTTTKVDEVAAFTHDTENVLQFQTPVGFAVQGHGRSRTGWISKAVFDLSVTPTWGDRSTRTSITGAGLTAVDHVQSVFADRVSGAARVGFSAEKNGMSFGADGGISIGDKQKSALTFGLKARYRF